MAIILITIQGGGGEAPLFLGITVLPAVVIVALVWFFGRWALIVGAVVTAVGLLLHGPPLITGMTHFNSFFDFSLPLVAIVGLLLALVGCIVAFIQRRRGTARTTARPGELRVLSAIALVIAALAVISGLLHLTGRGTVPAAEAAGAVVVDMKNTRFDPDTLQASEGDTVRILVRNRDFFMHTIHFHELNEDQEVLPFGEKLIEVRAEEAGEFRYHCEIPEHEDMEGALVVTR